MTEVSNPRQGKQKRQFKFIWPQKYYSARLNAAHGSRRWRGLNYQKSVQYQKVSSLEAAAYNQNKVYRESPALFVIFCFLCTAK